MYIPSSFRIDDVQQLTAFVRRHSFATLVTHDGQHAHATHLPMLLSGQAEVGGRVRFHLARVNPQWQHLAHADETLCIFSGPHTYVSPSLYAPGPNVPTWNYTAVHIYGQPRIVDQLDQLDAMLTELVDFYESMRPQPWIDSNPRDYRQQLLRAIVGVDITISRVEGKFKLNQNRMHEVPNVIEGLSSSDNADDQAVAAFMRRYYQVGFQSDENTQDKGNA